MLDLARADDQALLAAMLAKADVLVQNLKPGAVGKLGFPLEALRRAHPRLVICSISGYGEDGPYAARKAYDMLIQAESGLASITGGAEAPARVGVSVCDIAAGMNACEAILEALIARERTGDGAAISISMFDAMADWMAVPLIQHEGGAPPLRMGLAHTSIAPYGVFKTADGADILISIQSDREWRVLAEKVLGDAALAADPDFATNVARVARRAATDGRVAAVFGATDENDPHAKTRRRRHRLCPRQHHRRSRRASAPAPHRDRHPLRHRLLPRPRPPPRRPSPPLRRGPFARRPHRRHPRRIQEVARRRSRMDLLLPPHTRSAPLPTKPGPARVSHICCASRASPTWVGRGWGWGSLLADIACATTTTPTPPRFARRPSPQGGG